MIKPILKNGREGQEWLLQNAGQHLRDTLTAKCFGIMFQMRLEQRSRFAKMVDSIGSLLQRPDWDGKKSFIQAKLASYGAIELCSDLECDPQKFKAAWSEAVLFMQGMTKTRH